jgi:hypothetical protein
MNTTIMPYWLLADESSRNVDFIENKSRFHSSSSPQKTTKKKKIQDSQSASLFSPSSSQYAQ